MKSRETIEKRKAYQKQYQKQHRLDNLEKEKARQKQYYLDNYEKINKQQKQYELNNPEKIKAKREREKQFARKHIIRGGRGTPNSPRIIIKGLNKRDYPENNQCELCNKEKGRLAYHHWDNSNPSIGIWVCWHCHCVCEAHEKKDAETIIQKYVAFKRALADEVSA